MTGGTDGSVLAWIKQELDATLGEARSALESYVEDPQDEAQLGFCATQLHQVFGTLQMVELHGASMLAEEMEALAGALRDQPELRRDKALEALLGALLQLPDYLERLVQGGRDLPLALLPMVNDMRAARGVEPLAEKGMFSPNLDALVELKAGEVEAAGDVSRAREFARKFRPLFQRGLLAWIRNQDRRRAVVEMARVIAGLEHASVLGPVVQLWWLGGALLEALATGALKPSPSVPSLLGDLDRQMRRLVDDGEAALAERPSQPLIRNLLFHLAEAAPKGERVVVVKETFGLAAPSADEVEAMREGLGGRNQALMETVGVALKEDLAALKDTLDLFVRGERRDLDGLGPMAESLKRVADTFGMLGAGRARQMLQEQAAVAQAMASGERPLEDQSLLDMAGTLLYLESSVEDQLAAGDVGPAAEARVPKAEMVAIRSTVLGEALQTLARAREAVSAFVEDHETSRVVGELPTRLVEVRGSLLMLGLAREAAVLEAIRAYAANELVGAEQAPEMSAQDRLADAIAALEYHLEAVAAERAPAPRLLDRAENALTALGYPPGTHRAAEEAAAPPEAAVPAPTRAAPAPLPVSAVFELADDLDPEIAEIFVEEAGDEFQVISELLPRWLADAADEESLKTIRRSFHTLKGSGRLVGAHLVGEFAWAIENMLNRVLDRTIEAGPAVHALMQEAVEALGQLLEQLKGGAAPSIDVNRISEQAHRLAGAEAAGEAEVATEAAAATEAELPTEAAGAAGAAGAPAMDPVLLEIFTAESATHLQTIEEFLGACGEPGSPCHASEPLARALHTLHGSARMAGALPIAELSGPIEQCVKLMRAANLSGNDEFRSLLTEMVAAVRGLLTALATPGVPWPDTSDLVGRIEARHARLVAEAEAAEAAAAVATESPAAGEIAEPQPPAEAVSGAPEAAAPAAEGAPAEAHDDELLGIFLEEGAEILEVADGVIHDWQSAPDNLTLVERLQRELHTLKGGARMAGLIAIGDLSHLLESLLEAIAGEHLSSSQAALETTQRVLDRLHGMLDQAERRQPVAADEPLMARVQALLSGEEPAEPEAPAEELAAPEPVEEISLPPVELPEVVEEPAAEAPVVETAGEVEAPAEAEEQVDAARAFSAIEGEEPLAGQRHAHHEVVRVRADMLDDLVNFAGEVSIYRARLEQEVGTVHFNLLEMAQTAERLRDQLRDLDRETEAQIQFRYEQAAEDEHFEFDPLEMDRYSHMQQLSRALAETAADLANLQQILDHSTREAETLLLQQSRVNTELQEGLMRSRMLPFSGLLSRLRRLMRQTGDELGRRAELQVDGAETELDRKILDRIVAPLEHMVRNAVFHGVEPPEERRRLGKPEVGRVHIGLSREGGEIVLRVHDDGRGIDLAGVRARAVERGLLAADAEVSEPRLLQFILEAGFSTTTEVTQISGRGVGMDVVNTQIKQIGGTLEIDTEAGTGTTFTIHLPLTLSVNRAIMVQCGDESYAVPLTGVAGVARVSGADLERMLVDPEAGVSYGGQEYPVTRLNLLLGLPQPHEVGGDPRRSYPLLLLRAGNQRLGMVVEHLHGSREIVVKSVGPQIGSVPGVSGATILGDGSVVLILDTAALLRRGIQQRSEEAEAAPEAPRAGPGEGTPLVMVVDDSITIRKVMSRFLERNAMRVVTAKDGLDAVAQLQETIPDVFLLDIEMPRMDGYELATHIRNTPELKEIPIIMITSRTGEKHRARALEIGVDRYLGKPYKESELLENIHEVLGGRRQSG